MIYVISGARRTGTSMLMQAIHAGNTTLGLMIAASIDALGHPIDYAACPPAEIASFIDIVSNKQKERQSQQPDGYSPNPNGAYEVGTMAYHNARFLRNIPPDSLIKVLFDGLPNLPRGNYKIIYMERDVDEIRASTKRVEEYLGGDALGALELTKHLPFSCFRPYNQEEIDHVLGICRARCDIDIAMVNYNDVINDPLEQFNKLKSLGWPIIPEVCASEIDQTLYRSRKELGK